VQGDKRQAEQKDVKAAFKAVKHYIGKVEQPEDYREGGRAF
jgi:hypothetical protein